MKSRFFDVRLVAAAALAMAPALAAGAYVAGAPTPAAAQPSDCYATFWPSGRAVEIEACEYRGGGSGYTVLRNNSRRDMEVCWTLEFGDGTTSRGCNFRIRAGEEAKSSCHRCSNKQGGGVDDVVWRKVQPST